MERIGKNLPSSREKAENTASSRHLLASRNRYESDYIEKVLDDNGDVVEPQWEARHAKLIQVRGIGFYEQLAYKARTYGKSPKALMGSLVNKEMNRIAKGDLG